MHTRVETIAHRRKEVGEPLPMMHKCWEKKGNEIAKGHGDDDPLMMENKVTRCFYISGNIT